VADVESFMVELHGGAPFRPCTSTCTAALSTCTDPLPSWNQTVHIFRTMLRAAQHHGSAITRYS